MTEKKIQDALWTRLRQQGHNWMCPNYTPAGYWECDMFSTTKSGLFVEHEIKLTVSDFRADTKKERTLFMGRGFGWKKQKKHDVLGAAQTKGPSRFWYVAPEGMLALDMLPEWAGLLTFEPSKGASFQGLHFMVRKKAPKLHNEPCNPKILDAIGRTFYWRFWYGVRRAFDPGAPTDYMI